MSKNKFDAIRGYGAKGIEALYVASGASENEEEWNYAADIVDERLTNTGSLLSYIKEKLEFQNKGYESIAKIDTRDIIKLGKHNYRVMSIARNANGTASIGLVLDEKVIAHEETGFVFIEGKTK